MKYDKAASQGEKVEHLNVSKSVYFILFYGLQSKHVFHCSLPRHLSFFRALYMSYPSVLRLWSHSFCFSLYSILCALFQCQSGTSAEQTCTVKREECS